MGRDDENPGHRVRHDADRQLVAELQAERFSGPQWERLKRDLAAYGYQVMLAWIQTGQVFDRLREKTRGISLRPPSDGRSIASETAEELAIESVALAIPGFQRVLEHDGWSAARGASLRTFFIGQCLFAFVPVFKRWLGETRPAPWREIQILDLVEADYRYTSLPAADPAEHAVLVDELEQEWRRLDNLERFVVQRRSEGYTVPEIAEMLGRKPRSVERLLGRLRERHRPRERGGKDERERQTRRGRG